MATSNNKEESEDQMCSSSKKINVDFEAQFSEKRIRQSKNRISQEYHEMMKEFFKNENELCDWILNLWKYAKYMDYDDIMETYALCNLELIRDHWDHEKYISCEFLIDHLLKNYPSFFNFEVFIQPKKFYFIRQKFMILSSCHNLHQLRLIRSNAVVVFVFLAFYLKKKWLEVFIQWASLRAFLPAI